MTIKRLLSWLLVASLILSLAACSSDDTEESEEVADTVTVGQAGETYTGTVSAVSTDTITITTEDQGDVVITVSDDTVYTKETSGITDMGNTLDGIPDDTDGELVGETDDLPSEAPNNVTSDITGGASSEDFAQEIPADTGENAPSVGSR